MQLLPYIKCRRFSLPANATAASLHGNATAASLHGNATASLHLQMPLLPVYIPDTTANRTGSFSVVHLISPPVIHLY